jgi:hypothetical protein
MTQPVDLEKYLRECTQIEPLYLEEEFVRLPADIAFWTERYAQAYHYALDRELYRKTMYGKLYSEHSTALAVGRVGARGPSVELIKAAVEQDPMYIAACQEENNAESAKVRLYGVVEALRAKKDALVSIGAQRRAEMSGDPMIRRDAAIARAKQENEEYGGRR